MIFITQTYETVTEQSVQEGETSERGINFEGEEFTFRELVDLVKMHPNCSCYPAHGNTYEWLTSQDDLDYCTGETTTTSIHFSEKNPARNNKYWKWAMLFAGIIKPELEK